MKIMFLMILFLVGGCASMSYEKTVDKVELKRFMGKWYVIAGRLTFMEDGAHNAVELYQWNDKKERIDISFTFNKDGFDGEKKSIPQKGWIYNPATNAHWKVSPFWPLKFHYLVIDLAEDYSWTVVGVPDQKYVWIMAREWNMTQEDLSEIITRLNKLGYSTKNIKRVPQRW